MPYIHRSCRHAENLYLNTPDDARPTVVNVLYDPSVRKLLLVTSPKQADEPLRQALKPVQGGIDETDKTPGELTVVNAFLREAEEEVGIVASDITDIYGVRTEGEPLMADMKHRRRDGKCRKLYVPLCGLVRPGVELEPNPDEVAHAGWYTLGEAATIFTAHPADRRAITQPILMGMLTLLRNEIG